MEQIIDQAALNRSTTKTKVLLVDDHPFVVEGLKSFLQAQPNLTVVADAADGLDALAKAQQLRPDVVLMDITMPKTNGLDATRQLRKLVPEARVLILTTHEKREFALQAIEAGAYGFLSKNASPAELLRAIETLMSGGTFFAPDLSGAFLREYVQTGGKPAAQTKASLSLRERQVLTLIAEGLFNKEDAGKLGISVRTVEKHRERIMDKLGLHSVVDLTRYAIAQGLVPMPSAAA